MVRHIVVALLGCLYVAASVWLVQSEGRAYRKALQRPRAAIGDASAVSPKPSADETKTRPLEKTVTNTASSTNETTSGKSSPSFGTAPPATANERQISPSPTQVASTRPSTSIPDTQPMVRQPANTAPAAAPANRNPLWNEPATLKSWNLDTLSTQDEMELGTQLYDLIIQLNPVDTGSGRLRISEAAKPLLDLRSRKDINYTFTILNSEIANAFSHPGGFIYVSRKLLDMVPEGDDEILQFIIGHEIAHVDMKHAIRCLQAPDVRKIDKGTLWKLYVLIIPLAYPDELELAADQWAFHQMKRIGKSDYECLRFLRKLEYHAKAEGFADGRGKLDDLLKINGGDPKVRPVISPLDNHLRAHPAPKIRSDALKQLRDQNAKGVK